MTGLSQEEGKVSRGDPVKRSRSLSKSLRGLFRAASPPPKPAKGSSNEQPASGKKDDILKKLTASKEAELSNRRRENAGTNFSSSPPLANGMPNSPVLPPAKHHRGLPSLGRLSLSPHRQPADPGYGSAESIVSESDSCTSSDRGGYDKRSMLSGDNVIEEEQMQAQDRDRDQDHDHDHDQGLELGRGPEQQGLPGQQRYLEEEDEDEYNQDVTIDTQLSKDFDVKRASSLRKPGSSRSRSGSRSLSIGSRHRDRATTVSAPNMSKYSENDSKCVLQHESFRLFEDGRHEHNLKVVPILLENQDGEHRVKSSFSLSGFFKGHKDDDKLESALSLLPRNRYELHKRLSLILDEDEDAGRGAATTDSSDEYSSADEQDGQAERQIPRAVNRYAAIGAEELKLINKLVAKINDQGEEPAASKPNYTLCEKYGKSIGVIGNGAYGTVKVCCKTLPHGAEDQKHAETYQRGASLYYAVKELKRREDEPRDKFGTRLTSEFVIGHALSGRHKSTDPHRYSSHPNILKVLDLMQSNDGYVEVMEFCPSGDLYSLLTRTSKSGTGLHPLEADCFMKQLLHGVQYMHDHGVAHCDLKPENILFKPNGVLKIADFGTSCVFQTAWEKKVHFQTGAVGSEPYVAPEEFVAKREYDPRLADCWSCGIIYCTMVLGHYLWKIALRDKDPVYDSFVQDMLERSDYYVFEELRHVNQDLNRCRKMCLYNIFQWEPSKRIGVDTVLQTPWMKRTKCCVVYTMRPSRQG